MSSCHVRSKLSYFPVFSSDGAHVGVLRPVGLYFAVEQEEWGLDTVRCAYMIVSENVEIGVVERGRIHILSLARDLLVVLRGEGAHDADLVGRRGEIWVVAREIAFIGVLFACFCLSLNDLDKLECWFSLSRDNVLPNAENIDECNLREKWGSNGGLIFLSETICVVEGGSSHFVTA